MFPQKKRVYACELSDNDFVEPWIELLVIHDVNIGKKKWQEKTCPPWELVTFTTQQKRSLWIIASQSTLFAKQILLLFCCLYFDKKCMMFPGGTSYYIFRPEWANNPQVEACFRKSIRLGSHSARRQEIKYQINQPN